MICADPDCGTVLVPWGEWQRLDGAERNRLRAEGKNQGRRSGFCSPCEQRREREGAYVPTPQHACNVAGLEAYMERRRKRLSGA